MGSKEKINGFSATDVNFATFASLANLDSIFKGNCSIYETWYKKQYTGVWPSVDMCVSVCVSNLNVIDRRCWCHFQAWFILVGKSARSSFIVLEGFYYRNFFQSSALIMVSKSFFKVGLRRQMLHLFLLQIF